MIKRFALFILGLCVMPQIGWAAPCSRINLTKCLDSACAINLSSNPAARCQYCGTADAGTPTASAMKSVTAGASSKNTISAKDLKKAPSDPGDRYIWASKLCLGIVPNCTSEDISEAYDPLIEKSCTAAGISNDMATLQKKAAKNTKNATSCTDEISLCITAANKCNDDFSKCSSDEQFNNAFATCSSQATGCTNFIDKARNTIAATRKNTLSSINSNIYAIVASHKQARLQQLSAIGTGCKQNSDYDNCVTAACQNNTSNNCATQAEQTIANGLCQFYKTACTKVSLPSEKDLQKSLDELIEEARKELSN